MIVDVHTHDAVRRNVYGSRAGADQFIAGMDAAGIDKSIVYTCDGLFFQESGECNDQLHAFVQECPDRMVAGPSVFPRWPGAAAEVRRCRLELGMRGPLKFHPWLQGISTFEPYMDPIVETCIELGIPMIFHDGTPTYSGTLQIANLAARYPELIVIMGHSGIRHNWIEALAAVKRYPNVWLTLCGTAPYGIERIVAEADPTRLMFGTDAGFGAAPGGREYRKAQITRLEVPEELKRQILGENARRLFNL